MYNFFNSAFNKSLCNVFPFNPFGYVFFLHFQTSVGLFFFLRLHTGTPFVYCLFCGGAPNEPSECSVPAILRASFTPHFCWFVLKVKASEPPYVFNLWLEVVKVILPVYCSHSLKSSVWVGQIL